MVQDSVSNVMLGKMRMQFWRDAVKSLADVRAFRLSCSGTWTDRRRDVG